MSRIGNKLIHLPEGTTITVNGNNIEVKGKLGTENVAFDSSVIGIKVEDGVVTCTRANEEKHTKQLHGTTRALLNNAVVGCSVGFCKELEIVGIGYKAEVKGNDLVLNVGYSNPVTIKPLDGVQIVCPDLTHVQVKGINKFKVGQVAAKIHDVRPPEPYLGKGIKYKDEVILRKEGKRATAGA